MGFEWTMAEPGHASTNADRLEALWTRLASSNTKALFIAHKDSVVLERYANDWSCNKRHYTASLVKALVGGVSLMLALDDGVMDPDDVACRYIPQWRDDPLKSRITIRHLATHSSGIEDPGGPATVAESPASIRSWKGQFWPDLINFVRKHSPGNESHVPAPDPFCVARDVAQVLFPPGESYHYSNPGIGMLSYAVTAAIQGGHHRDIRTMLRERVMRPIGVHDHEWSIGYEGIVGTDGVFEVDDLPIVENWGGGSYTARATARVGRLLLRAGNWDGRQIVSEETVRLATAYAGTPLPDRSTCPSYPASGLCWYTNSDLVWPTVPRDAFAGLGAGHQFLLVVPSMDLVLVRYGGPLDDRPLWEGIHGRILVPLMKAVGTLQHEHARV